MNTNDKSLASAIVRGHTNAREAKIPQLEDTDDPLVCSTLVNFLDTHGLWDTNFYLDLKSRKYPGIRWKSRTAKAHALVAPCDKNFCGMRISFAETRNNYGSGLITLKMELPVRTRKLRSVDFARLVRDRFPEKINA